MSIKQRFASAIYHARKDMGITQERAAEALDISLRWFQMIEYGHRLPSTILTLKIFAFFEIDGKVLNSDPIYVSVSGH